MSPSPSPNIRRIAVVGTGLIGSSWTTHFLARGFDVAATDPAPGAEARLRDFVERAWPDVTRLGLAEGASPERLQFFPTLDAALDGADFVQENGPERAEFKTRTFAGMDRLLPPDVILATSSSGLTMTVVQQQCAHPERCVIGHPFNPPHLIPLVEVVGGKDTSEDSLARAEAFYRSIGKKTIRLRREIPGHVANRLQAALWREAAHLVNEGVVSVEDVDTAVHAGPGLRWALMGPNLIFHLGGGEGGIEHFMQHLSGPFSQWWEDLGRPALDTKLKQALVEGTLQEARGRSIQDLARERDRALIELLKLRKDL